MNDGRMAGLLAVCLAGLPVLADIPADSGYRVILERNPFGLKDPPPEKPVDPSTTNVVVKVDVKLTGISSDGVTKRAHLVIPPSGPVRPGQTATQQKLLSLQEGDVHESLKVLEIDHKAATVKVVNAGQTVVLNFKDNALPLTAVPPPAAGAPGAVPRPGQPVPGRPGVPVPSPGIAPVGTTPTAAVGTLPQPGIQAAGGLKPIPARNVRTSATGTTAAPAPTPDPAAQYLQMKAAEELARRYGVQYPPPPPPGPWNATE